MDTKAEVEDYLERLLGKRSHQDFIREFLLRWTAVVEERRHHGNMEMIVAHSRQEKEELVLFEPKKTTKKSKKVFNLNIICIGVLFCWYKMLQILHFVTIFLVCHTTFVFTNENISSEI